jgi:hypothetical protein
MFCCPHCSQLLHPIQAQQYCSILLTSVNNVGSKTLFNPVKQRAQRFYACTLMIIAAYLSLYKFNTQGALNL